MSKGTVVKTLKTTICVLVYTGTIVDKCKKSFPVAELQRQHGHKRYQAIWRLYSKLQTDATANIGNHLYY